VNLSSRQAEDHFIADVGSYLAPEISGYDNPSTHADFGCNISSWHSSLALASIKDITRFVRCGTKPMPWGVTFSMVPRPPGLTAPKGSNKTIRHPVHGPARIQIPMDVRT